MRAALAAKMPVLLDARGPEWQVSRSMRVSTSSHGLWDWDDEPRATATLRPGVKRILDRVIESKVGW
jgi:hypothetical protein